LDEATWKGLYELLGRSRLRSVEERDSAGARIADAISLTGTMTQRATSPLETPTPVTAPFVAEHEVESEVTIGMDSDTEPRCGCSAGRGSVA
jgi:hypothetical protein